MPGKAIGIDIGGTKMAVGVVNNKGTVLHQVVIPTEAGKGFSRAINLLADAMGDIMARASSVAEDWEGIGIGCAGPVDSERGLINNPFTLAGWDHCDIITPLRERFRLPVFLENDVAAAALGEWRFGVGCHSNPMLLLMFGTGVGGAIIRDGFLYKGLDGKHPELGHIPVFTDGPECYCGMRGCLESLASGNAMACAGIEIGCADPSAVFDAAKNGNAAALKIVDQAIRAVVVGVWSLCHTFLPQRVVLGGGIMESRYDLFAPAIEKQLSRATQFPLNPIKVVRSSLGGSAGIVGAASMVFADRSIRQK
jgi:glucokinase